MMTHPFKWRLYVSSDCGATYSLHREGDFAALLAEGLELGHHSRWSMRGPRGELGPFHAPGWGTL